MLTELQYFGTLSYIKAIQEAQTISFDENELFSKMSFKNRTIIASAQGPLNLTIPIIGGRDQKNKLKDILIDYSTPWHHQHLKSIKSCYKRAPFFDYYEDSLSLLLETKEDTLFNFLINVQEWVKNQFKNNWSISELHTNDTIEIFRDPYLPKNYATYTTIRYQQVFEDQIGFLNNLSVLDILFCCGGKQASNILKSS
jgi:hypothetical protein